MKFEFPGLAFECCELLAKCQISKTELGMRLQAGEKGAKKCRNDIGHDGADFGRICPISNVFAGLRSFRHQHRAAKLLSSRGCLKARLFEFSDSPRSEWLEFVKTCILSTFHHEAAAQG